MNNSRYPCDEVTPLFDSLRPLPCIFGALETF